MALGYIMLENLALDATLSGGDWGGTLDRLQDPRITSNPARCADASDLAASQFTLTWPSRVLVTDLLLGGHTALLDSRYRITGYDGETELLQIDWTDFYGRQFNTADLPYEQSNWHTGKPLLKDITGVNRHRLIQLPTAAAIDSMVVELDVADVDDAGLDFDLGYVHVAASLTPEWPYTWGRKIGMNRRTVEEVTAGGRKIRARRTNARDHKSVVFPHLTKEEAMRLQDFALRDGEHPVVFVPDPSDLLHAFREIFPAWMTIVDEPTQSDEVGDWSLSASFEEMQG